MSGKSNTSGKEDWAFSDPWLVYSIAYFIKYVYAKRLKSGLGYCSAYLSRNKTINPLFWLRNIAETWRIEWPHKFLCEDFDTNMWRKK